MKLVERVRTHPLRYVIPWSMTLARPKWGYDAMRETQKGNWNKGKKKFLKAAGTDFEGIPARLFDATSLAGAIADPVMDGILRTEAVVALAPEMPVATGIAAAAEVYTLVLNNEVQRGRDKPFVPLEAKAGSLVEAVGAYLFMDGKDKANKKSTLAGEVIVVLGAGIRAYGYRKERNRMRQETATLPGV